MKLLLGALTGVCLATMIGCSRQTVVGQWKATAIVDGRNRPDLLSSKLSLSDDNTFEGEIASGKLIVTTRGTYSLRGRDLDLSGTQTLVRSAGTGTVGSSKPYRHHLIFEGDQLRNPKAIREAGGVVVYERIN